MRQSPVEATGVTILVPDRGETFDGRLIQDERGVLILSAGKQYRLTYVLSAVLAASWRIVDATPAERALLQAHGLGSGRLE